MIVLTAEWDLSSLRKAIQNARGLGEDIAREEVLEKALLTVGRPLRDELKRVTPRSKVAPHLADQWIARLSKFARGFGRSVALVGPKAGKGSVGYVAPLLEFGTWKMAARPFIRPAWDVFKRTFNRSMVLALRKHYNRVVRKYTARVA